MITIIGNDGSPRKYTLTKTRLSEKTSKFGLKFGCKYFVTAKELRKAFATSDFPMLRLGYRTSISVVTNALATASRSERRIGCAVFSPSTFKLILKTLGVK